MIESSSLPNCQSSLKYLDWKLYCRCIFAQCLKIPSNCLIFLKLWKWEFWEFFIHCVFSSPFDLPYLVFDHTHLDFPILLDWKDEIQFCWRFLNKWGGGLIKSPINDVQMNVVPKALYRHWGAAASNFHKMEHIIKSTPPPISLEIENWIFGKQSESSTGSFVLGQSDIFFLYNHFNFFYSR